MRKSHLLTREVAKQAVELVLPTFEAMIKTKVTEERKHLHIVVMDPVQIYTPKTFEQAILYEHSITDSEPWKYDFKGIARSKAGLTRKYEMPTQIIMERMPYLLKSHDVRWFGSAYKDGIAVAASGIQPWFDQAISEMVASMCQALCIGGMQGTVLKQTTGDAMDGQDLSMAATA